MDGNRARLSGTKETHTHHATKPSHQQQYLMCQDPRSRLLRHQFHRVVMSRGFSPLPSGGAAQPHQLRGGAAQQGRQYRVCRPELHHCPAHRCAERQLRDDHAADSSRSQYQRRDAGALAQRSETAALPSPHARSQLAQLLPPPVYTTNHCHANVLEFRRPRRHLLWRAREVPPRPLASWRVPAAASPSAQR